MSRTRRFYNRRPFGTWRRYTFRDHLFRPYGVACMGRCHSCRDPNKEQRKVRKARATDLRRTIKREIEVMRLTWEMEERMYCALGAEASLARDWLTPEGDAAWAHL